MDRIESYAEQVEGDIKHYYGSDSISRPTEDLMKEFRRSMRIVSMMTPLEQELMSQYTEEYKNGKDVHAQVRELSKQVEEREGSLY